MMPVASPAQRCTDLLQTEFLTDSGAQGLSRSTGGQQAPGNTRHVVLNPRLHPLTPGMELKDNLPQKI